MGSTEYLTYIYFTEVAISLLLQVIGLYLLITVKPKKPMDLLLIHLICVEVILLALYIREWFELPPLLKNWAERAVALTAYCQTLCMITIDRVLCVKLSLQYQLKVTKRKIIFALLINMLITVLHGVAVWFYANLRVMIYFGWSCMVMAVFIIGYTYILITIIKSRRLLSSANTSGGQRSPKYSVPLFIVLTFIAFYVVPMTVYHLTRKSITLFIAIGMLNFIADQVIYILGTGRLRKRIRNLLCKNAGNNESTSARNI